MDDAPLPVVLGSMLFTCVEPHAGHEVAYNRWYERDHYYAGVLVGPGTLAGRRFVARRDEKALRRPERSAICPDPMGASYLAVYWIQQGLFDSWNRWAVDEVNRLHAAGRMFEQRDHVYTVVANYDWGVFRDPDGVPAELALDHPYAGLAALVIEPASGVPRADLDDWLRQELSVRLRDSPLAMALCFSPVPLQEDAPSDVPRAGVDACVLLAFLEREPEASWGEHLGPLARAIEASGAGRLLWASPFIPTSPGTDAYTDCLR